MIRQSIAPPRPPQKFNKDKFKELVVYIARKSEDDPKFGDVKLNKIMFFAEFFAFGRTGQSITGQKFQVLERGPGSKPLLPVRRDEMQDDCRIVEREYHGRKQRPTVALREADLSEFSGDEIEIIDEVIAELRPYDGEDVSKISHNYEEWRMLDLSDEIPYELAYFNRRELTPAEIKYARSLKGSSSGR